MSMFNSITVVGNLVKDPIVSTPGEKEWSVLRIACNSGKKENADTLFIDVKAFGNAYNDVGYFSLKKGDRVSVTGCLKNNSYDNKDGVKIQEYAIYADLIMKVSKREYVETDVKKEESPKDSEYPF